VCNFFLAPFLRGLGDLKFESDHAKIPPAPLKKLTFHEIWKTSLLFLSPCRRETLNLPPFPHREGG
jgi:hypothetical protein